MASSSYSADMSAKFKVVHFNGSAVSLVQDQFGTYTDKNTGRSHTVRRFTWQNAHNVSVQVITYGATITSIKMPNRNGVIEDIVLGFDDMQGYLNPLNPYIGATIGRVANRIGCARMTIDGVIYDLTANNGKHQLHGGLKGFDKVNWNYYVEGNRVVMTYLSRDNEEGFPGDLLVRATFELGKHNEFIINYDAFTTKPTFVNLANHAYFNLAGHNQGARELYRHEVAINADRITEVDNDLIPTGKLLPVTNTIYDLRIPKVLGSVIDKVPKLGGFDNNFCITKGEQEEMTFIARVYHPGSGRLMEIYSNQPGVQFYTSNGIPERPKNLEGDSNTHQLLRGKGGCFYFKHAALCLETQNYPDAINHANFPKAILTPFDVYRHTLILKFYCTP